MRKNAGFTPIVALIVILLVIAGIYLGLMKVKQNQIANPVYSPSPTVDTTNWKTYSNKEFGFTFQYPLILDYFREFPLRVTDLRDGELSTILETASKRDDFFLKISVSKTNLTPQEWVENHNCPVFKNEASCTVKDGSILGSRQYIPMIVDNVVVEGQRRFVATYVRNQAYLFEFLSTRITGAIIPVDDNIINKQDQILSTFKFN